MSDLWFKRKKYGWGWTPTNFKGWLVVSIYIIFVTACISLDIAERLGVYSTVFIVVASTLALISICYKKGPKPHWQWFQEPKN